MTLQQLNERLFRKLNIIVSKEEESETELHESFKRLRGIIAFSQEEIDSDDRLSYLHGK